MDIKTTIKWNNYSHIPIIKEICEGLKATDCNDKYLELGVAKGGCFCTCAPLFKNAIGVDMNPAVPPRIERQSRVFKQTKTKWQIVTATTDEFFEHNDEKEFNFIFIDAKHSFEQSRMDFVNAWPLLKDNGIMLLHDTYPPNEHYLPHCEDAWKLPEWIKQKAKDRHLENISISGEYDNIELMTLPFYFGITIIRKMFRQVEWL